MRLATYENEGETRAGVVVDEWLFDAKAVASNVGLESVDGLLSTRAILEAGSAIWTELDDAARGAPTSDRRRLSDLTLRAPVENPDKVICLGLNYRDHATEANLALPTTPMIFAKFRNSLVGPTSPVVIPPVSSAVDFEAELAVVIGRQAKRVSEKDALDYVAGVMALNDVTARDVQHATSQWGAGKAIDTFAPCGPVLVLLDEIEDIQNLRLQTRVNGDTLQDGNTAEMIFSVAQTIEFLTRLMTLVPGDIIATGTPAGVGASREPKAFLSHGDEVEVEVEGVGILRNFFVAEGRSR